MRNTITSMLLLFAACCYSSTVQAAPLASASMLAKAALLGVQASAKQGRQNGKVSQKALMCIQAVDASTLVPVFETAARENWSPSEIAEIEKFLESEAGKKFVRGSIAQAVAGSGGKVTESVPTFTQAETRQIEQFQKTPGGRQLMGRNEFASEKSRRDIRTKLLELLHSCGIGR